MNPINKAINTVKKYQNPASPLELDPAIITDSPTGKGRIKMLRRQIKDAKKAQRDFNKELEQYDYITDQSTVDELTQQALSIPSLYDLRKQLKRAKDEYRSKNFLGVGDGSGNALPSQLYRYWSRHFGYQRKHDPTLTQSGTDIVDLSNNVIRLTPESEQSTALFNEFVERRRPSVHQASEYQSGNIESFGDQYNIPTKNISLYAGVEDGKFKVDSLQNFNPQTIIYPARNIKKNTPKIHGIDIGITHENNFDYNTSNYVRLLGMVPYNNPWITTKLTLSHPDSNPYLYQQFKKHGEYLLNNVPESLNRQETRAIKRLISGKTLKSSQPFALTHLMRGVTSTERGNFNEVNVSKIMNYLGAPKGKKYTYIDSEGNKHPIQDYNAAILDTKMVLGNPNGGVFIGKFQDISPEQLDSLNLYLSKNPSWLVRPDLGSFDQYRLDNPSLKTYLKQYFEHPKEDDPNVYTVGTTTPNKLW